MDDEVRKLLRKQADKPRSERVKALFNFEPTDYQAELLDYCEEEPKAQAAPKAGRQVGKTIIAGVIGADHAITHDATDVLFGAPAQATANEMFRECKQHFKNSDFTLDQFGVDKPNEQTWEFDNGTRILSRTLGDVDREDNPGNRGMNPTCVCVDEAAYEKDAVYTEEIEEFFITHAEYEYCLFSTPRAKSGYFYRKVEVDESWYSPHWKTEISPFAQQDYIERKREEFDKQTFEQEFLGEFVDTDGSKYLPRKLVMPCVRDDDPNERPALNAEPAYLGVDVARAGADRTVYIVIDEAGDVVRVEAEDKSKMTGVVGRIKRLDKEYDFAQIRIDENAVGGGVVDFAEHDLGAKVEPTPFTNKSKQEMYQSLKKSLEDGALSLPDNGRLVHELTALEYSFTPSGKLKVEHPPGGHDDYADAVALANLARTKTNNAGLRRRSGSTPKKGSMR
jgi:hypothetical protein